MNLQKFANFEKNYNELPARDDVLVLVYVENFSMLKNAYLDAKLGVDPAENEPRKE